MAVTTQEDARDDLDRKSKKRKKRDASQEHGNVPFNDEGHRKKKKKNKEISVDHNASKVVTDEDSNFGAHNSSRKDTNEERTNRRKKKDEVTDSKSEKTRKNEPGDDGETSQVENITDEIEPMEEKSRKKKKKAEDKVNGNTREKMKVNNKSGDKEDASLAEAVSEEVEPVEDCNREKKKKADNIVNDSKKEKKKKKNRSRDEGGVSREDDVSEEVEPMEDRKREKKKKKKKKTENESKADYSTKEFSNNNDEHSTISSRDHTVKSKKNKKKRKDELGVGSLDEEPVTSTNAPSTRKEKSSRDKSSKKKKKKVNESNTEGEGTTGALKPSKRKKNPIESSERSTSSKKSKMVRFSDKVEYLSLADNSGGTEKLKDHSKGKKKVGRISKPKKSSRQKELAKPDEDGLIRGKRFSIEEDETIKNSVLDYIEKHQLGEMGMEMILNCSKYPELKGCWKEIGESLPWRPYFSVYNRAHIIFDRSESRQWTPEEVELLRELYKKHGPDWKKLGGIMGKNRIHVKDTWRRIRYTDTKRGQWSQDEYESLFELVNIDLRLKAFQEKKSQHGMLRDNIGWEAIGEKISTRGNSMCCQKWYEQLTSPMVAEGIWADADDYRLITALNELDAACLDEVDWDNLLEHRSGYVCRKRWNQMVKNIGEHGNKSFGEQVDILSQRYCPDLLEDRLAWDSRTPVD